MQKKESSLEFFKNAIISTIKSISKKNDCEIKFGKSTNQTNSEKLVSLPEINKLENINDFLLLRAKADSEALRLKHSNKDIFELHKPKGEISQKLYQIAEKIRYEKIGSEDFLGIRKNLFNQYKQNQLKLKSNKNKLEESFDSYLKSFFFDIKEPKKSKVNFAKKFKQNLNFLKENLDNQSKFNQKISELISELDINDKEFSEDREDSDQNIKNPESQESKDKADGQVAEKENEQELSIDTRPPDTKDLLGEDEKSIEEIDESGERQTSGQSQYLMKKGENIKFIPINLMRLSKLRI